MRSKPIFNHIMKVLMFSFLLFIASANLALGDGCNHPNGFNLTLSNFEANQTYLNLTQFKAELLNDSDFKDMHTYAQRLGYIYPSQITKTIYGNLTVITVVMTSTNNDFIFLSKLSSNEESYSMLIGVDNSTIVLFNKDGGMKINVNASSISSWCTHHSCNMWKDCYPACLGSKFGRDLGVIVQDVFSIVWKCKVCYPLCKTVSLACKGICFLGFATGTLSTPPVALACGGCLVVGVGGVCGGCIAIKCGTDIRNLTTTFYGNIVGCKDECRNNPSSYSLTCTNEDTKTTCGYGRTVIDNETHIILPENLYQPNAIIKYNCTDCEWTWEKNVEWCAPEKVCVEGGVLITDPHCEEPTFFGSPPGDEPPAWTRPRPDDRYDISKPTYYWSGNFTPETMAEVGVLFRGHMLSTSKLLARFNEPVIFLDVNFEPEPLKYPILVIPSGGLYGLDSSPTFRNKLEQYVSKGGTIFTFSQQYGYEYSALPGELSGFGWEEDQSCQQAGVAISEYHPVLAGQDSEVSDVQVDGYFTKWPSNATIPLTRTKNGMPALVIYKYGNGTVIASTIFTDWNYEHGQATEDGINLVRDIIAWVKYPEEIPEYGVTEMANLSVNISNVHLPIPAASYPEYEAGDLARIPVNVTNFGNKTADRISFSVFDPEYEVSYVNLSVQIAPNQTKQVNFTYQTENSSQEGIYFVIYSLYANETVAGAGFVGGFSIGVNTSMLSQYKVLFTLRDPDKNVIKRENVSVSVEPGGMSIANFTYQVSKLGIWYLEYSTVDFNDTEIESEVRRFAVSKFSESAGGFTYQAVNVTFGVNSDREHYAEGSNALFTIWVKNQGITKNITCWYSLPHNYWVRGGAYGSLSRNPGGSSSLKNVVEVPAYGENSFTYSVPVYVFDQIWVECYSPEYLGRAFQSFSVYSPSVDVKIATGNEEYYRGENVSAVLELKNKQSIEYNATLSVKAVDPDNSVVYSSAFNTTLNSTTERINLSFKLPSTSGVYRISAEAFKDGERIGYGSDYFRVAESGVSVVVEQPDIMAGENAIFVNATNQGLDEVNNTLTLEARNPSDDILWSETQGFNISANETKNFTFTAQLGDIEFGTYKIVSRLNGKTSTVLYISCSLQIAMNLNQSFYRVRDSLGVNLSLINPGDFLENLYLLLEIPDMNFSNSTSLILNPGVREKIPYNVKIPPNMEKGKHLVRVTAMLNNSVSEEYSFFIPDLELSLTLDREEYSAGEDITIRLENEGGVDTAYSYRVRLYDPYNSLFGEENLSGGIEAGEIIQLNHSILEKAMSGSYFLIADVSERTGKTASMQKTLKVTGLESEIESWMDKLIYSLQEVIGLITEIQNKDGELKNAKLEWRVVAPTSSAEIPIKVYTGDFPRKDYRVERVINFTQAIEELGVKGVWNSVRVAETDSGGDSLGDISHNLTKLNQDSALLEWVMNGSTAENTYRYYQVQFDVER